MEDLALKDTRSILDELTRALPPRDHGSVLESRCSHLMANLFNVLESIESHYGEEIADEVERRLLNSIKNRDAAKFLRSVKKLGTEHKRIR